jgi:putative membrane protein
MWGDFGGMGWGAGWGLVGFLHMALWWVLIILGIAVLAKWLFAGGAGRERADPIEILKQRYARGEIQKEEFEQKKRDLAG